MKNVVVKSQFLVPIYEAPVLVVIAYDAIKAYNLYLKRFDQEREEPCGFGAISIYRGNDFAMFFHADRIGTNDIAHEIRHTVDNIMIVIGAKPPKPKKKYRKRSRRAIADEKARKEALEEPEAYLTGYLHQRVYDIIAKHEIKLNG